jgi:hypothetical protein
MSCWTTDRSSAIRCSRTDMKLHSWLWGLFGFVLMTAYWPGISGVATTPRWDVAALLAVVLFFLPRIRMTATHWLGLALIGWLFLSIAWNDGGADGRLDGIENGLTLLICLVAFAVGSQLSGVNNILIGAALGIGVNSAFAIAQWFGWTGFVETFDGSHAGLFYNPDRLAAAAAMVAVGLVALPRLWVLLPLLLPSLVLAPSRGAWLALIAGCSVLAPFKIRLLIVVTSTCFVAWVALHGFDASASQRFMIWQDTIANLTVFGHGIGSFREDFIRMAHAFNITAQQSRPEHPHNEWLWLAFEGGVPAVGLGMLFAGTLWQACNDRPEFPILACLFVLALFAMPFHDPATLVLGALCAGCAARHRDRVSDRAVHRGGPLRAGLSADATRARAF